jgi:U3 small nucleolar RNA-associated protein 20
VGALVGVVQPLLLQMIVEGKGGDDSGHELKQAEVDRGANVTDAAVVALGALAGALPWVQYQQLLGQHLRLVKKHADDDASKAIIRSVCAIIDAFHFPLPVVGDEDDQAEEEPDTAAEQAPEAAEAAAAQQHGDTAAESDDEAAADVEMADGEAAAAAEEATSTAVAEEVYRMLSKRVVPELQRIMVDKDKVRAHVALAGG